MYNKIQKTCEFFMKKKKKIYAIDQLPYLPDFFFIGLFSVSSIENCHERSVLRRYVRHLSILKTGALDNIKEFKHELVNRSKNCIEVNRYYCE